MASESPRRPAGRSGSGLRALPSPASTNAPGSNMSPPLSRTSPTTTSASASASASLRSCHVCHHRKVRCDKKQPCTPCSRSGKACTYPPAGQPVRRPRKTTMADVASRISQLEKSLVSSGTAGTSVISDESSSLASGPASTSGSATAPVRSSASASTSALATDLAPTSGLALRSVTSGGHQHRETPDFSSTQERGQSPYRTRRRQSVPAQEGNATLRYYGQSPADRGNGGDENILVQTGSSNQYFNEILLSRVIEEVSQKGHSLIAVGRGG